MGKVLRVSCWYLQTFLNYRENPARRGVGAESALSPPSRCGLTIAQDNIIDSELTSLMRLRGKEFFPNSFVMRRPQKSSALGLSESKSWNNISDVGVVQWQTESLILITQKQWTRRSHRCFWRWIHLTWWPELRWPGEKKTDVQKGRWIWYAKKKNGGTRYSVVSTKGLTGDFSHPTPTPPNACEG